MKKIKTIITAILIATTTYAAHPDKFLGNDFECQTFKMNDDYSGKVRSTLIKRVPLLNSNRAILYIHGYNDYFFQEQMANRFYDSAYNFYAIDLRKYGRSYNSTQTMYQVRDMHEYFADIDSALMVIRNEGARKVILMGHSTGGLTASYYCGTQEDTPPVEGLILNSPFLDMNLSPFLENIVTPVASAIGAILPDLKLYKESSTSYYESLHKEQHGEWEYDTTLKPGLSPAVTAGWIRAIHEAQKDVQQGYNLEIPILLMYSDKSIVESVWCPEHQVSDSVLDVKDIKEYGSLLGQSVNHAEIKDGIHDIILSGYEAREEAYRQIFKWLDKL